MAPRIWLIAGPTASGKSALALRLAEAVGAEVVGADSMQLYRDLPVLTACPTAADLARAPHHLLGEADAAEPWSTGRWLKAAEAALDAIAERGRPAVVVGGTGLYFHALTEGLAPLPAVPREVRDAAAAELAKLGEGAFRDRLAAVDPRAEARIAAGDRQRLTRAWEVHAATGRALSDWQADTAPAAQRPFTRVLLNPPRDALVRAINGRVEAMPDAGVLDELAALAARRLDPARPLMKAVGYREFAAHLAGELSLPAAVAAAQVATRQYAKRQGTWMRGRMAGWPRLDAVDPQTRWTQFLALEPGLTGV